MSLSQGYSRLLLHKTQIRHLFVGVQLNCNKNKNPTSDQDAPNTSQQITEDDKNKSEAARQKLSKLLNSMLKEPNTSAPSSEFKVSLNLAKPKPRTKESRKFVPKSKLEPEVLKAIDGVSEDGAVTKEVKADLVTKLEAVAAETELARQGQIAANKEASKNLNSILSELKVETKKPFQRETKATRGKLPSIETTGTLLSGKPLGIFNKEATSAAGDFPKLTTWDKLHSKELKLTITQPPANGFEEMILWTEQGKMWKFPVNNEQGLEAESKVGFFEHVFLERHLESWCPRKGPIRHFMELVCTGLSKNPYLTVERKKDHIEWFRKYFEAKRNILVEVNAIPENHEFKAVSSH